MYRYPDACIIQFAKAPLAGKVKTRLLPALGEQGCVELHKALVEQMFEVLVNSRLAACELCITYGCDVYFNELVAGRGAGLSYQQGKGLGQRMANAFCRGLEHYGNIIIVGSDCPFIDAGYLAKALDCLGAGNSAVFGPALDGGYVLIGLNKLERTLFEGIPWGSDAVMACTRNRVEQAGLTWCELPPLADIDDAADLNFLSNSEGFSRFLL